MTITPDRIALGADEPCPEGYWVLDRPVEFPGTVEEKAANYRTHLWLSYGDPEDCEIYCDCGCKPWHIGASYPCGVIPPRERIAVKIEEAQA